MNNNKHRLDLIRKDFFNTDFNSLTYTDKISIINGRLIDHSLGLVVAGTQINVKDLVYNSSSIMELTGEIGKIVEIESRLRDYTLYNRADLYSKIKTIIQHNE